MNDIRHRLARLYFYLGTYLNIFRFYEIKFLWKHLKLSKEHNIIDVACGIGVYANSLSSKVKTVTGIDFSLQSIRIAHHLKHDNMFFYQGNAEYLGHPNNSFDSAISICSLEHFSNSKKSLEEIFRILKPNGQLLITVDSLSSIDDSQFIEFHRRFCLVKKYFTVETIQNELKDSGFEIDIVTPFMTSSFSANACRFAFRIMKWPRILNIYSILIYPLTLFSESFSKNKSKGIIIGVYAHKPKEGNK